MSQVTQLGYVGIEASDLDAWERFAVDVLGLQLAEKVPGRRLVLRMDERAQRVVVSHGPADDLAFSGWETASQADLEALVAKVREGGVAVERATAAEASARRVEDLYVCQDPDGNRVEFYAGPAVTSAPFRSTTLLSSFVTGSQGFGHVFVLAKQDRQRMVDFYADLLGLKLSDYIRQELAPGIVADAAFFHCNGRHHSFATAVMPFPKRVHHLMVQVASLDDVGLARDRCVNAGFALEMDLGRHPNDKMFSFYAVTPSGFAVEFGWGAVVVDDATWSVRSYDVLSEWGHHHPPA